MKAKQTSAISTDKPNGWISNATDRGRKSVKNGNKVYLKDNQEFLIELFNPLKECVLADVRMNGKSVSSTGLVLKPGQRFYLDCFLDDKKKFVFKTYEVENTSESLEAISNNGMVEIFFYKEETVSINNWKDKYYPIIERRYYPVWYPWYQPYWYYNTPLNTPIVFGTCNTYTTSNISLNNAGTTYNANTTFGTSYNQNISTNCTYTSNSSPLRSVNNYNISTNLETGRVEKGSKSNQVFTEIEMEFENFQISQVAYQLLPESRKPVETKEIKSLCLQCGKKLKGIENFCSKCGIKLK